MIDPHGLADIWAVYDFVSIAHAFGNSWGKDMWKRRRVRKFGNKKITIDGHKFDSQFEAAVYLWLVKRAERGEISDLKPHPGSVLLSRARIALRPDFSFIEEGTFYYGEAKGAETAVYRIKRRLWKVYGTAPLRVWIGRPTSIILKETIVPEAA